MIFLLISRRSLFMQKYSGKVYPIWRSCHLASVYKTLSNLHTNILLQSTMLTTHEYGDHIELEFKILLKFHSTLSTALVKTYLETTKLYLSSTASILLRSLQPTWSSTAAILRRWVRTECKACSMHQSDQGLSRRQCVTTSRTRRLRCSSRGKASTRATGHKTTQSFV